MGARIVGTCPSCGTEWSDVGSYELNECYGCGRRDVRRIVEVED